MIMEYLKCLVLYIFSYNCSVYSQNYAFHFQQNERNTRSSTRRKSPKVPDVSLFVFFMVFCVGLCRFSHIVLICFPGDKSMFH